MDDPDEDRGSEYAGDGFKAPVLTPAQLDHWTNRNSDKIHRESVVIPLVAASDEKVTTKRIKFTISGTLATRLQKPNVMGAKWDLFELISKQEGITLTKVETVKFPKAKKAVAVAGTEKVATKYMVVSADKVIKDGFTSQSAARAEAIRLVNSDEGTDANYTEAEVRGYLVREGAGRALVKVARPESETVEVELKLTFTEPKVNAKPIKYVVLFDYHH
jgi:hypothetical protein